VCEGCGQTMRLLASIGNANESELGFTGNEFVQMLFHFCDSCSIVTAENLTD